jgi:hypothetical protein
MPDAAVRAFVAAPLSRAQAMPGEPQSMTAMVKMAKRGGGFRRCDELFYLKLLSGHFE